MYNEKTATVFKILKIYKYYLESYKFKILVLIDYYNLKLSMNIKYLDVDKYDLFQSNLVLIFRLTIVKVNLIQ